MLLILEKDGVNVKWIDENEDSKNSEFKIAVL